MSHTIRRFVLVALLLAGVSAAAGPAAAQQIRELPSMNVPDAQASYDAHGPVIYYNPVALRQMTPGMRSFLVAHEYAHHYLGHLRFLNTASAEQIKQMELQADCLAAQTLAQQGNVMALREMVELFARQGTTAADAVHPPGIARAQIVARCAG
jgi:Zn-dependent peptidase ImmA (M78 family)